jgi:maltokinase
MTPSRAGVMGLSDAARAVLAELATAFADRRPGWDHGGKVVVLDAEVLVPGRPGIVDVIARRGARELHVPFGLRAQGAETRFMPDAEDPVLGIFEDNDGPAIVLDAVRDMELAALLLRVATGRDADSSLVRHLREDEASVTLVMEDRIVFTVYYDVVEGRRPDLEMFLALDEVGFNHLPAPLAVWRRAERDLGLAQEYLPGASSGYALALTSVRDLYASGGPPEVAGGDFGAEAHRIGTMTARMHLGLDKAFGRRTGDIGEWADGIEESLRVLDPRALEHPDTAALLTELRGLQIPSLAIRTHGDFHLGRTCRTEQGWYVMDFTAAPPATMVGTVFSGDEGDPVFRSPLADVADMLWSFGHVARTAAEERDPSGREGLGELAEAWEARNRRAFLAGYLGVPGISGLVPPGREVLRVLTAAFSLARAAAHRARLSQD